MPSWMLILSVGMLEWLNWSFNECQRKRALFLGLQ
uniref:Uncharacterized protein n=1 Tax=Rhizophora mucronata TaxID=61149 RepID=A0A2P2QJN9_RHIMU